MKTTIDRDRFFKIVRVLFQPLGQSQVDGFNIYLDKWEDVYRNGEEDKVSVNHLAYILATVWWESGRRMQPIREGGVALEYGEASTIGARIKAADEEAYDRVKRYLKGKNRGLDYIARAKNGVSYYGRGPVQVTHETNYQKIGDALGVDLLNNPDLLLVEPYASDSVFVGMYRGLYTGVGLRRYIDEGKTDFWNARRIVNGTDKAGNIKIFAERFVNSIKLIEHPVPVPVPVVLEEADPRLPDLITPHELAQAFDTTRIDFTGDAVYPETEKDSIVDKAWNWVLERVAPFAGTNDNIINRKEGKKMNSTVITVLKPILVGLFAWIGISFDPTLLDNPSVWGIVTVVLYGILGILEKFVLKKEIRAETV